jgi:hypothetical protein
MGIACGIGRVTDGLVMLSTIDLDHDARCVAGEVDDQVIDGNLAAEVEAARLQPTERAPQLSLGVGLVFAKVPSVFVRQTPPIPAPPRDGGGG